jgi:hypothetical protein
MKDDDSYIIKASDVEKIVRMADTGILTNLSEHPLTTVMEVITGLLSDPKVWLPMAGRIAQGALKLELCRQVIREVEELRKKGKIPDDFADKKNGAQSWVELLRSSTAKHPTKKGSKR